MANETLSKNFTIRPSGLIVSRPKMRGHSVKIGVRLTALYHPLYFPPSLKFIMKLGQSFVQVAVVKYPPFTCALLSKFPWTSHPYHTVKFNRFYELTA